MKYPAALDWTSVASHSWLSAGEYHEQLISTNARGLTLAQRTDLPMPYLVFAESQTGGRGRGSNRWFSSRGALTFSLIWGPDAALPQRFPVSILVGTAICRVIASITPRVDVGLKWPNDVLLDTSKVCGILIESIHTSRPRFVIGIGINVSNSLHDAPPDVRQSACSLRDRFANVPPREALLRGIMDQLGILLQPGEQQRPWQEYCLLTGAWLRVATPQGNVTGTCEGIDETGCLIIRTKSELVSVLSGEVQSFRSDRGSWCRYADD